MTHKHGFREMSCLDSTAPSTPGGEERRTVSSGDFAMLWHSEVPKVVQMHQEERLQVRRALGLA
jgi:hypothetical protein